MRHYIQLAFTALSNGYVIGFAKNKIYQGKGKQFCFPGLNCYSCPGAVGACPVGAVQASLTGAEKSFPFYALGFLLLFGVILGRGVCGFFCPFGLVQDLLHKIPFQPMKKSCLLPKIFRKLPFVILVVFVLGLPLFLTDQFGISAPSFCKWICPSGTLLGGVPLLLGDEWLRSSVSWLFAWKFFLLVLIILWSVIEYRPFCKYFCPLGGFYGLFHSFSFLQIQVNESLCTACERCDATCHMGVKVRETPNSSLCIRCGDCCKNCPTGALSLGFVSKNPESPQNQVNLEEDSETLPSENP
ncbi:MAG: 4Fe-4S binding protein [Eubacteriales bacterium]